MKALCTFVGAPILLFLAVAFGVSLWQGYGAFVENWKIFQFEFYGVVAYFALRVVFFVIRRNLEFAETFCHELNHTVFAVLSFHKVESFFAHADEGGQVTFYGGTNPVISLAPYTFPLFAFATAWISLILIPEARIVAQGFVGFFLMFHLVSVFHEARPRQTDLQEYGYAFSYAAILFANLFWVPVIAWLSAGGVSSAWTWAKSGFEVAWNWGISLWSFV